MDFGKSFTALCQQICSTPSSRHQKKGVTANAATLYLQSLSQSRETITMLQQLNVRGDGKAAAFCQPQPFHRGRKAASGENKKGKMTWRDCLQLTSAEGFKNMLFKLPAILFLFNSRQGKVQLAVNPLSLSQETEVAHSALPTHISVRKNHKLLSLNRPLPISIPHF